MARSSAAQTSLRLVEESDEALLKAVQNGDEAAFKRLVDRNSALAFGCAMRITGYDRAQAEDIVQKAFLKLWSVADKFDPAQAKFTTWFFRVVTNLALDEKRKRVDSPLPEGFDQADHRDRADKKLEQQDQATRLRQAIGQLSPPQRAALTLTYFEELSNADCAAAMDISVKALESHLVRGRRRLRDILEKEGGFTALIG